MTAKEKALELIDKMNNVDLNCKNESMCMLYPHAIECALIAVDDILNSVENEHTSEYFEKYWDKVKKEILTIKNKL